MTKDRADKKSKRCSSLTPQLPSNELVHHQVPETPRDTDAPVQEYRHKGRGRKWICLFLNKLWGVYDVHYVLDIQIYLSLLCMDVGNVNFLLYVTSSSRQNSCHISILFQPSNSNEMLCVIAIER